VEITNYDVLIAKNWGDEETISKIYAKIANDYSDNPDLRLTWLDNLQVFHVQNGKHRRSSSMQDPCSILNYSIFTKDESKSFIHRFTINQFYCL